MEYTEEDVLDMLNSVVDNGSDILYMLLNIGN